MVAGALVVASLLVEVHDAAAFAEPDAVSTSAEADAATGSRVDSAETAADAVVAARPASLMVSPGEELYRTGVFPGANDLFYTTYERLYRGLPVIRGDTVVVTNAAGALLDVVSALNVPNTVSTSPAVTEGEAKAIAQSLVARPQVVSEPRLVVVAGDGGRLAWESIVVGFDANGRPARPAIYVDAQTGEFLMSRNSVFAGTGSGFYSGIVPIGTSGASPSFAMTDLARPGLRCGGVNAASYLNATNVWGNGSGTSLVTACVDALYAAGKESDMLATWLGRTGIDGNGGAFPIQVGINEANAYWFPGQLFAQFGHSGDGLRQATSLDIVGHELGHAVFQFTPGGNGADADLENGGLNEGSGDIFGTLTEAFANNPNDPPDFDIGEKVNLLGGGPLRRMYNPAIVGDPGCYSAAAMSEVHAAAGPLDHWFYLLSQGSNPAVGPASPICAGGPARVTGLGIQAAGRLFYNGMLTKTSTWKYGNVRVATLRAARYLYPSSCAAFNVIRDAWNAVGVGAQAAEPTCVVGGSDFAIALSTTSRSVPRGGATAVTVTTAVTVGSTQSVLLSASGLPAGATATFNPPVVAAGGTSLLTLRTSAATPVGRSTIIVTGQGSAAHSAAMSFAVTPVIGGVCPSPGQKLGNPGFESGAVPWGTTPNVIGAFPEQAPHGGTRVAWLNGYGISHIDTLSQTVSLPAACTNYVLSFWLHISTAELAAGPASDTLTLQVLSVSGSVLATLATYSNLNPTAGYALKSFSLAAFAGRTIQLRFAGIENSARETSFVLDDTAVTVS
jgi:Zn-dependent metalloprotease